jgi:hypothetical protein
MYNPSESRDYHGRFGSGGSPEVKPVPVPEPPKPVTPEVPKIPGAPTPEAAAEQAKKVAAGYEPLAGLPQKPIQIGDQWYQPGPIGWLKDAAAEYMKESGMEFHPPTEYAKIDKERAAKIAQAFDDEKHDPNDPKVKASYAALAKETLAQWKSLKDHGLKVEWVKPGMEDPYAVSPRLAAMDVSTNNHWWGFPSDLGFGSDEESKRYNKDNPLLQPVPGEVIDGRPVVVNDVFRIVHDMFGHLKEGNGFRSEGEENAWRSHASMFSDLARPAMTNETRGQNSWVNYGPYGATNRTAQAKDTHFAPQKIGLLPDWAVNEGRS